MSNILEQDGTVPPHVDNKLVAFLVNIEKAQLPHRGPSNGKTVGADKNVVSYAPVYLNFYLMFAGNSSGNNYMESLKFISNTISFFNGAHSSIMIMRQTWTHVSTNWSWIYKT